MNIIQTIETDLTNAWSAFEADAEKFGAVIWGDFKPILLAVEPAVYGDLKAVIVGVLTAFGHGGDLAEIETAVLNVLSAGKTALLGHAQSLGSNLLQLLISVVKAS